MGQYYSRFQKQYYKHERLPRNNSEWDRYQKILKENAGLCKGDGKCVVCGHKYVYGRGFTVHHIWRLEKNDAKYNAFDTNLEYQLALNEKIKENPQRFVLLCETHHYTVTRMIQNTKPQLDRLYEMACISINHRENNAHKPD